MQIVKIKIVKNKNSYRFYKFYYIRFQKKKKKLLHKIYKLTNVPIDIIGRFQPPHKWVR